MCWYIKLEASVNSRHQHGAVVLGCDLRLVVPQTVQQSSRLVVTRIRDPVSCGPCHDMDHHHTHIQVTIQLQAGTNMLT